MRCTSTPNIAPTRVAFTLMELLVVISIIMLLMGMLFAGIRMARDAAARAKTQSTISALVAACENYRQANGRYPEGTVANPPILQRGFNDDPQAFGPGPYNQPYTAFESKWDYINGALVDALNSAGESFKYPVVDAWKKPIQYRPARYYPYLATATEPIDSEDPPNRDSFQLWSIGKDKKDDAGKPGTDDVTSWTK